MPKKLLEWLTALLFGVVGLGLLLNPTFIAPMVSYIIGILILIGALYIAYKAVDSK